MRRTLTLLAGLLPILALSSAMAEGPLPILRGIVLLPSGEGRAYFEDPRTRVLRGYALRETVGDSRIEQITEDRVVLRRGGELVPLLLGVQSAAGNPPPQTVVPAVAPPPPPTAEKKKAEGPIIGSGQPWLDRLGVPPQALSRAIEQAAPAQNPDD